MSTVFSSCPGSLWFKQPVPEPIICPHCGKEVEIFTNEQAMTCYHCGGPVTREKRPSCFDWCKYADLCMAEIETQRRIAKGER
jgi:endogenous inhibitor of DNA gyrase (YacG/DUF329 family)